ncbi:MAG: DUF4190 domain-containing protein [Thermobispora bispora]|nr:DUF4190 domain-containing protein [Thermobispora bispora]
MTNPYGQPNSPQQPTPPHLVPQQGPGYAPGPYAPPPGYAGYQPPAAAPEPRNGLGLAALICTLIALAGVLAPMPILFLISGPLAIVALCLGIAGQARVSKGRATNGGICAAAILLGLAALLGAINDAHTVFTAVDTVQQITNDNQRMLDCVNRATTPEEIAACAD